jgi:hypothetical protein
MDGTQNLQMVLRMQDAMRRDAASQRLAMRTRTQEPRKPEGRRVFGLRLSLA